MLLSPEKKKVPNLTIKIPRGLYDWLASTAEIEEKKKSQIIFDALREYRKNREQQDRK